MSYLYHRVPKQMRGTVLYPLNTLRDILPEVHEQEVAKYADRPRIPRQRIPLFDDCLWNDVLFTIAVHPQELMNARRDAGWPDMPPQQYFKIDPRSLDSSNLGVFLFKPSDTIELHHDDFAAYRYEDLGRYEVFPPMTGEYYKNEYQTGRPRIRLFYRYVPHILHHGPIDTAGLEVITVT